MPASGFTLNPNERISCEDQSACLQGRCDYSDGGFYVGEWEQGLPHGHGTDVGWPNMPDLCRELPTKWVGPMALGKRTGRGTLTLSDGRLYVGDVSLNMNRLFVYEPSVRKLPPPVYIPLHKLPHVDGAQNTDVTGDSTWAM